MTYLVLALKCKTVPIAINGTVFFPSGLSCRFTLGIYPSNQVKQLISGLFFPFYIPKNIKILRRVFPDFNLKKT